MQRLMKSSGLSFSMHSAGTTVGMYFPLSPFPFPLSLFSCLVMVGMGMGLDLN